MLDCPSQFGLTDFHRIKSFMVDRLFLSDYEKPYMVITSSRVGQDTLNLKEKAP